MTDAATILRTVEAGGHRVTVSRRAVADLIAGRTDHFTAADLVEDARARRMGIGRATIFRSLDLFLELGVVERLDLPDGQHAYVECGRAHHHHVVCSSCGRATDVEDCGLDAVAREVERRSGYRIQTHRLELFGLCPSCAAAGGAESVGTLTH
jgi:Fur family transcriptional regulator, ferric uptake regulator